MKKLGGKVGIIAAGTSDIGIAEEARLVCESMNCDSISSYDVGIAGLHRIFPVLEQFVEAEVDVIIVVAGMEGALASIVSSIADVPVIGVPTSIGYGYGEKRSCCACFYVAKLCPWSYCSQYRQWCWCRCCSCKYSKQNKN